MKLAQLATLLLFAPVALASTPAPCLPVNGCQKLTFIVPPLSNLPVDGLPGAPSGPGDGLSKYSGFIEEVDTLGGVILSTQYMGAMEWIPSGTESPQTQSPGAFCVEVKGVWASVVGPNKKVVEAWGDTLEIRACFYYVFEKYTLAVVHPESGQVLKPSRPYWAKEKICFDSAKVTPC